MAQTDYLIARIPNAGPNQDITSSKYTVRGIFAAMPEKKDQSQIVQEIANYFGSDPEGSPQKVDLIQRFKFWIERNLHGVR